MNKETQLLEKLIPLIDEMPFHRIIDSGGLMVKPEKYNQAIELINNYLKEGIKK